VHAGQRVARTHRRAATTAKEQRSRGKRGVRFKLIQPARNLPSSRRAAAPPPRKTRIARRKCTDRFCITPRRGAAATGRGNDVRRRNWRASSSVAVVAGYSRAVADGWGSLIIARGIRWMNISRSSSLSLSLSLSFFSPLSLSLSISFSLRSLARCFSLRSPVCRHPSSSYAKMTNAFRVPENYRRDNAKVWESCLSVARLGTHYVW